jgi:hypothetical protein
MATHELLIAIEHTLLKWPPWTSGRTNLSYLPKYFRKGEGERRAEQKRGGEKTI